MDHRSRPTGRFAESHVSGAELPKRGVGRGARATWASSSFLRDGNRTEQHNSADFATTTDVCLRHGLDKEAVSRRPCVGEGIARGLPDCSLGGAGLLHLLLHGVQVICGRDHREQEHEKTNQDQARLKPLRSAGATGFLRHTPPDPQGRQCQRQPEKIEQEFHVFACKLKTIPKKASAWPQALPSVQNYRGFRVQVNGGSQFVSYYRHGEEIPRPARDRSRHCEFSRQRCRGPANCKIFARTKTAAKYSHPTVQHRHIIRLTAVGVPYESPAFWLCIPPVVAERLPGCAKSPRRRGNERRPHHGTHW